jgi:hypothetical protein
MLQPAKYTYNQIITGVTSGKCCKQTELGQTFLQLMLKFVKEHLQILEPGH